MLRVLSKTGLEKNLPSKVHYACGIALKAGSHVQRKRKRKHKEVHTSNANASTVQYVSAIEYSEMYWCCLSFSFLVFVE